MATKATTTVRATFKGTNRRDRGCGGVAKTEQSRRREQITRASIRTSTRLRALESDEDEFAVFRFTLGSDVLSDDDVPRAVGALGGLALCANGATSGAAAAGDALARSEIIGAMLVLGCLIAPTIGAYVKRNEDGAIGGGGRADSGDDASGSSTFALDERASERASEDLAWASYAVLTNTLACGVMYVDADGVARVARGRLRSRSDGRLDESKSEALARATSAFAASSLGREGGTFDTYLSSRREIDKEGANEWEFLPPDAECVFACRPADAKGVVVAWSLSARAFGKKDRAWLDALALKLDRHSFS